MMSGQNDSAAHSQWPGPVKYLDLTVQFIGASDLPHTLACTLDPYFVANIDSRILYLSAVKINTVRPVWNERWYVKNVPSSATLRVQVIDKEPAKILDRRIGSFQTSISTEKKEFELEGRLCHGHRGTFWLKVERTPSESNSPALPYLFDGPVRYSRHFSPMIGRLTHIDDSRLYSTWVVYLKGVPIFFNDHFQRWNTHYKAAQTIFQGPTSYAVRAVIRAGHRILYARSTSNDFGAINDAKDALALLRSKAIEPEGSRRPHTFRIKPAIYTYVIAAEDNSIRFSETGACFFTDFVSKHALLSNCAEKVRYSGEFHPRPTGGWDNLKNLSDEHDPWELVIDNNFWELVIDNNSGTYAPDAQLLPALKALLEYNFPGIRVVVLDHSDPELTKSSKACKAYALDNPGIIWREDIEKHA